MTKERDANDILREEGVEGLRAFHATAEPFDESNPKFQNGKAGRPHGSSNGVEGEQSTLKQHKQQLLQSSAKFTRAFTPPDFLVEGILCRQYIYALTGHPGRGKT